MATALERSKEIAKKSGRSTAETVNGVTKIIPAIQDTTAPVNKVVKPVWEANLTDPMALENTTTPVNTKKPQAEPRGDMKTEQPEIKVDTTTTDTKKQDEIQQPDYLDDSEMRQTWIVTNLNNARVTNPSSLSDIKTFRDVYNYEKRSDLQKKTLDNWFGWYTKGKTYSNQTVDSLYKQYEAKTLSDSDLENLNIANPEKYQEFKAYLDKKQKLNTYANELYGDDKKETNNPFQAVIDNYMKNLQNFSTDSNLYTDYKNAINDETLKAEKAKIIDVQNQVDELNTQIQWVEDDVKARYEGTGATSGKIARIVADEQKALYKKMQLLNDQLTSASNVYTNKINTINDEFDLKQKEDTYNMQQRNQQMSELWFAMNLMSYQTPEQQDERERDKFIRQEEYTNWNIYSSDPATRRKAVEKAVDNVLKEFDWIPMARSREQMISDIQNMVDNGEELGTAITKNIREPIKTKPEYKLWSAKKLWVTSSDLETAGMTFKRNYETKSRDIGGGSTSTDSNWWGWTFTDADLNRPAGSTNVWADTNNFGNFVNGDWTDNIWTYKSKNGRTYSVFATAEDWYNALINDLKAKQTGGSSKISPNDTFEDLLWVRVNWKKWSIDKNSSYYKAATSVVSGNTPISSVDVNKLAEWIMKWEGTWDTYKAGWKDLTNLRWKWATWNEPTATELLYFGKWTIKKNAKDEWLTQARYNEIAKRKESQWWVKAEYSAEQMQSIELPEKATEFTKKSFSYGNRLSLSNEKIKDYEDIFVERWITGQLYQTNTKEALKSDNQKSYELYKENFITANLRQESWAAIAPTEFEKEEKKYFAQPWDSKEVVEQKRVMRELAIKNMYAQAGSDVNWVPISNYYKPSTTQTPKTTTDINYNINNSQVNAGSINNIVSGFYNY